MKWILKGRQVTSVYVIYLLQVKQTVFLQEKKRLTFRQDAENVIFCHMFCTFTGLRNATETEYDYDSVINDITEHQDTFKVWEYSAISKTYPNLQSIINNPLWKVKNSISPLRWAWLSCSKTILTKNARGQSLSFKSMACIDKTWMSTITSSNLWCQYSVTHLTFRSNL